MLIPQDVQTHPNNSSAFSKNVKNDKKYTNVMVDSRLAKTIRFIRKTNNLIADIAILLLCMIAPSTLCFTKNLTVGIII